MNDQPVGPDDEVRQAQQFLRTLGVGLAAGLSPADEVERRLQQVLGQRQPPGPCDPTGRTRTRSALRRVWCIARHLLAMRVPRRALPALAGHMYAYAYIALVIAAGAPVLGYAVARALRDPGSLAAHGAAASAVMAVLIVVGESRPILARHDNDGATTAIAFSIALLSMAAWPAAVLAQGVAVVVCGVAMYRHSWWRTAFNLAQHTLCLAAGAAAMNLAYHRPPADASLDWHPTLAMTTAGVVYCVANHLLVWTAVALFRGIPLGVLVRREAAHQARVSGAMVALAPVVLVLAVHSVWLLAVLFLVVQVVHGNALAGREREWEANHDTVTELPNLKFLRLFGEQALVDADRSDRAVGLVLLDVENLKQVNDTLGRLAGDELLRAAAGRMVCGAQPEELVARLDGGEFAVLLPGVRGRAAATRAAQCLIDALTGPVPVHGVALGLTVSVGLALYPDDAETFEGILQRADLARRLNQSPDTRPSARKPGTVDAPG